MRFRQGKTADTSAIDCCRGPASDHISHVRSREAWDRAPDLHLAVEALVGLTLLQAERGELWRDVVLLLLCCTSILGSKLGSVVLSCADKARRQRHSATTFAT